MSDQRDQRITPARIWSRQNIITTVLAIFIILSLLIHAVTILQLVRLRAIVARQMDISAGQVAELRQQSVSYEFPVERTFTIDTTVTVSETVDVPLNLSVPIEQTITVPISTPVGSVELPIPLSFTVPISNTISVPINKDIPIQTDIPINTTIPINLSLGDPPVGDVLQQLENGLRNLREQMYSFGE